jgi:hypothetical protein
VPHPRKRLSGTRQSLLFFPREIHDRGWMRNSESDDAGMLSPRRELGERDGPGGLQLTSPTIVIYINTQSMRVCQSRYKIRPFLADDKSFGFTSAALRECLRRRLEKASRLADW